MKLTVIIASLAFSTWMVGASVIPIAQNQARIKDIKSTTGKTSKEVDNFLIPESVVTYASNWGDNYQTYKLHSLLHQPVHPDNSETDNINTVNLREYHKNDAKQSNHNIKKLSGHDSAIFKSEFHKNNHDEREDSGKKNSFKKFSKTLDKLPLDISNKISKRTSDNKFFIHNLSNDESSDTTPITISSSLGNKIVKNASSKCVSPLKNGIKLSVINSTLIKSFNSTRVDKNKFSHSSFINESGLRPVSCEMLAVTIALAWCTYVL